VSRDRDNSNVQSAAMGPIPHSKERILVKIKFESRPVLLSKYHDSLLFMVLNKQALDRLCVRLNMYLVVGHFHVLQFPVLQFHLLLFHAVQIGPSFSRPAISLCTLVRQFHVLQFHALQF